MIEILCEECDTWTHDVGKCENCGAERPENVLMQGPEIDAFFGPFGLRPVKQTSGDALS